MNIPEVESPKPFQKIDTERLCNFLLTGDKLKTMTIENKSYLIVLNNPEKFGLNKKHDSGHCYDVAMDLLGIIQSGKSNSHTETLLSLIEEMYG